MALPNQYRNNIGFQGDPGNPNQWFKPDGSFDFREGGALSTTANKIPGINAVAGMHDVFQVTLGEIGDSARSYLNIPGMLVAAPVTAAALLSDPNALIPYFQYEQQKRIQE